MDIYARKQWWKILLLITAIVIVGVSLFYSNYIVRQISEEEREKVELWAKAVEERAHLVKYTSELFEKLKEEERKKVQLWAKGFRNLITVDDPNVDISFFFEVVQNNETVPLILTDENGEIVRVRNIDEKLAVDRSFMKKEIERMRSKYSPIEIIISDKKKNILYYDDSNILTELITVMDDIIESFISEVVINSASVPVIITDNSQHNILSYGNIAGSYSDSELLQLLAVMKSDNNFIKIDLDENQRFIFYQESFLLTQLKYYPLIQLAVITAFLLISYVLFSTARKAEQNRVWVGMSKETAHQLGTPISSLLAWISLLKSSYPKDESIVELSKDVNRLEIIAERFSKIGSAPVLDNVEVSPFIYETVEYLRKRISTKVEFVINDIPAGLVAGMNKPLMGWVFENLIRNAVDAMDGSGRITLTVFEEKDSISFHIEDTGKGISKAKFKSIFQPGYTTKKRGWGLGLTLVNRIVREYHNGNIFVLSSEPNVSTIFKIELNKVLF